MIWLFEISLFLIIFYAENVLERKLNFICFLIYSESKDMVV